MGEVASAHSVHEAIVDTAEDLAVVPPGEVSAAGAGPLVAVVLRGDGEMTKRACVLKNLSVSPFLMRTIFTDELLRAAEKGVAEAEEKQGCEIRLVFEGALPWRYLFQDDPVRKRAVDLFSELRIWDTAENNGILFYVLHSEQAFEFVADRGVTAHLSEEVWQTVGALLREHLQPEEYEKGVLQSLSVLTDHLSKYFPPTDKKNELHDRPLVLR